MLSGYEKPPSRRPRQVEIRPRLPTSLFCCGELLCLFTAWGRLAQTELVEQQTALRLAAEAGVFLEPLGGTGDGVICALAAVGLLATWNSGRVIHSHRVRPGALDLRGTFSAQEILEFGVDEIISIDDGANVHTGVIDLGKRLRPNMRSQRMVLFVAPHDDEPRSDRWLAQRIVA